MWTTAILFVAFLQVFTPKRRGMLARLQTVVGATHLRR